MIGQWNPFLSFMHLLQHAFSGSDNYDALTQEKALEYPPIWYGVNKIAGHIAQLPLQVLERTEDDRGNERRRDHNIAKLIRKPNAYQTSVIFREQLAANSILTGNGRAAIVRDSSRRVTELIPLHPECSATGMLMGDKVHASRPSADDRLRLFFTTSEGKTVAEDPHGVIPLSDDEVLHIPGLSVDGVVGLPLIVAARKNLMTSLAMEGRLNSQMEKGFQGNIMLQAPPGVFRKQKDALEYLDWFESRHHSKDKAGKPGLLREGITANLLAMNNNDAQFKEQRILQRQDAALWLGLEQILGDDTSVSYNSLEQKNLAYLMNTLNKWLKRWEEEWERKLLTAVEFEMGDLTIRFKTAALLKSDYQTTIASLAQAVSATIMTRNEARDVIDLNPVEGGDDFSNPNTTPGPSPAEPEEPEEDDEPPMIEDRQQQSARAAIRSHLARLMKVEANRVKDAAGRNTDFEGWAEGFYDNWEPKLAGWLQDIGLDPTLASAHCGQSKQQVLDAYTSGEDLEAVVAGWESRADQLMEADTYVCS